MEEKARRDLLPLWIKIFVWIFMLWGIAAIITFILGFWDIYVPIELYGLKTNYMDTPLGLFLLVTYLTKGIIALGLWQGWKQIINIALADAILGLVLTSYVTISSFSTNHIDIRLEIIVLIMYITSLIRIRPRWITGLEEPLSLVE